MKEIKHDIIIVEYDSIEELNPAEKKLILRSKEVVKDAYAPYSDFQVGAAVLFDNGEIITGTNQENAVYPLGLCAERVALFYSNSKFPDIPVKAIAIAAYTKGEYVKKPISPCGSCRQVMIETQTRYKSSLKIYLVGNKKIQVIENAETLLPLHFDDHFLKLT